MTSASRSHSPAAGLATATLYLVPSRADRLTLGRRLAAAMLSDRAADHALAQRGLHPDVIELSAAGGKEKVGIDPVRDAIRSAQFSPMQGDRKVCLIPQAESLTPEAANGLLKVLEEPPRGMVFALLAEHAGDLLPTIVSRSRVVRVPPPDRAGLRAQLEAVGYTSEEADWLERAADRPGEVERLLAERIDVTAARGAARVSIDVGPVDRVVSAALGGDPILRREALSRILTMAAALDADLLTIGVRMTVAQERPTVFLFLQELLTVGFDLLRNRVSVEECAAAPAGDGGGPSSALLERACSAIDRAHRALSAYAPTESVLLSLFLTAGGLSDAQ